MEPTQDQPQAVVSNHGGPGKAKGPWLWIALAALPVIVIAGALIMWTRSDSSSATSKDVTQAKEAQTEAITIDLTATGPNPAATTVKKGQAVTWENKDGHQHRLTADQSMLAGFDSTDPLAQGDTYTYTFENAGTFHYYDPADPTGYNGTVTVE